MTSTCGKIDFGVNREFRFNLILAKYINLIFAILTIVNFSFVSSYQNEYTKNNQIGSFQTSYSYVKSFPNSRAKFVILDEYSFPLWIRSEYKCCPVKEVEFRNACLRGSLKSIEGKTMCCFLVHSECFCSDDNCRVFSHCSRLGEVDSGTGTETETKNTSINQIAVQAKIESPTVTEIKAGTKIKMEIESELKLSNNVTSKKKNQTEPEIKNCDQSQEVTLKPKYGQDVTKEIKKPNQLLPEKNKPSTSITEETESTKLLLIVTTTPVYIDKNVISNSTQLEMQNSIETTNNRTNDFENMKINTSIESISLTEAPENLTSAEVLELNLEKDAAVTTTKTTTVEESSESARDKNKETETELKLELTENGLMESGELVDKNELNLNRMNISMIDNDNDNDIDINQNVIPEEEVKPLFYISAYAYNNFEEPSASIPVFEKCTTLRRDWQNRISSLNTNGKCVEVCRYKNCGGRCILISPGTVGHNRLRDVNFDKLISSIRTCKE